jgi:hypothetical protein
MLISFRRRPVTSQVPARYRRPVPRWFRLMRARVRRIRSRSARLLMVSSGWVWVAAASLVGFEMFEVVVGTFLLAPELLPVVLIGLASAWYFRAALRRTTRWVRVRLRLARLHRRDRPERSVRRRSRR